MLSRRLPALDDPNAWFERLAARRASGARLFDLAEANPTAVGLSGFGRDALAALAHDEAARYVPDARGAPAAREAIARDYAARGITVAPDHLVLTSGTSEAYAHLFRLLCDPGDQVLVPRPSYPLFEPIARLEGVRVAPYRLEWEGRWRLDRESLERAAAAGGRAVVVVQPNHPTGSCLDGDERRFLDALCARHGLAIVSDEVFGDFPWPGSAEAHLPSLLASAVVPTFALAGLSKWCGLPQLKLSWIAAAGPEPERAAALRGLEWIADLFLSVSSPVQLALPRLLAEGPPFRAALRARLAGNLERLRNLVARRPELELREAAGGWVAVLRMPGRRSDEEWALELLRRDVVVHPGHFYDFEEPWYLVLSLIVEEAVFTEGLDRLEATLDD